MSRKKKEKQNKAYPVKDTESEKSPSVEPDFDILRLLRTSNIDTKPNMSKFLKQYVDTIRISTMQKIQLYPKIHYDICKAIVRFKNNAEFIQDFSEKPVRYYMFDHLDEISLTETNLDLITKFFRLLMEYRFIRDGNEDVKVFSTDVERTNQTMEDEMKNS